MSGTQHMRPENIDAINVTQAILQYRRPQHSIRPSQTRQYQKDKNSQYAHKKFNEGHKDSGKSDDKDQQGQ